jgi:hypothetical protein
MGIIIFFENMFLQYRYNPYSNKKTHSLPPPLVKKNCGDLVID